MTCNEWAEGAIDGAGAARIVKKLRFLKEHFNLLLCRVERSCLQAPETAKKDIIFTQLLVLELSGIASKSVFFSLRVFASGRRAFACSWYVVKRLGEKSVSFRALQTYIYPFYCHRLYSFTGC